MHLAMDKLVDLELKELWVLKFSNYREIND